MAATKTKQTTSAHALPGARGSAAPRDSTSRQKILARIRSVEGHVRAVAKMVEEDAYCIDVLRQTKAIQAALARVDALLLERHLGHCVSRALRGGDAADRERVIAEILDVFEASKRS